MHKWGSCDSVVFTFQLVLAKIAQKLKYLEIVGVGLIRTACSKQGPTDMTYKKLNDTLLKINFVPKLPIYCSKHGNLACHRHFQWKILKSVV